MPLMKCEEVEKALVFYQDQEVAPGERRLIEQHLAGCTACQQKSAALAAARKSAGQALQGLAAKAEPSPRAWELLQSRLAKEALPDKRRPMLTKNRWWNARQAPRAGRTTRHTFLGDHKMRTKIAVPALAVLIVMAVIGIFLTRNATPVSAQQVLERAYQAKSAAPAAEGISHVRSETFLNIQVLGEQIGVERTIRESYLDLSNGISRQVRMDAATGKVLSASGFDGSYSYFSGPPESGDPTGALTLYRTPQSLDKVADQLSKFGVVEPENAFEDMRKQPDRKNITQETWTDGRAVYVLRAPLPEEAGQKFKINNLRGENIMVIDANTYDLLENRMVMQQDGKEVVLTSYRMLVNEILPAGSPVDWDLSDLQGITWVDDPTGEHGKLLPEVITAKELSEHTQNAYLLKNVPAGFTLEISAMPRQKDEAYFTYVATYRNSDNDLFVIQSDQKSIDPADFKEQYQTASGLTLYYLPHTAESSPKEMKLNQAIVAAPGGAQFILSSTLPRERIEALAEDLELVK